MEFEVNGKRYIVGIIADCVVSIEADTNKVVEAWTYWEDSIDADMEAMKNYIIEKFSKSEK